MKNLSRWLGFIVGTLISSANAAATLQLQDYAYGMPIETKQAGSLYQITLPLLVYQKIVYPDLSDVAVFNQAGQRVPFSIVAPKEDEKEEIAVAFFPVYGASTRIEDVNLQIAKNSQGTFITINPQKSGEENKHFLGYLLDVEKLQDEKTEGIKLLWQPKKVNWMLNLTLSTSNDLKSWRPIWGVDDNIAFFNYQGNNVIKNILPIKMIASKYILLSSPELLNNFTLEKVLVIKQSKTKKNQQWLTLDPLTPEKSSQQFEYHNAGFIPVTALTLVSNSLIEADIASKKSKEDPWQTQGKQIFYNLNIKNQLFSNEPLQFPHKITSPWWQVTTVNNLQLDASQAPQLKLGYEPDTLIFIAQGRGPFMLAFGSSKAKTEIGQNKVAQIVQTKKLGAEVIPATLGAQIELGGPSALEQAVDKKALFLKIFLWAILILGVAVVGWLVWRTGWSEKTKGKK